MSHYDDTHWDRQKLLHFPIEILYADLWLLAAIHHFNTTPKALTYLLRTDKRRLWALHIGKVHAAVDMVDCSLSKASQLRRYQNLVTHESQHS